MTRSPARCSFALLAALGSGLAALPAAGQAPPPGTPQIQLRPTPLNYNVLNQTGVGSRLIRGVIFEDVGPVSRVVVTDYFNGLDLFNWDGANVRPCTIFFDGIPRRGTVVEIPGYSAADPNCRPGFRQITIPVFGDGTGRAGSAYICSEGNLISAPCCRFLPGGCPEGSDSGPATAGWAVGAWTYRTASGFTDTHELLADGTTNPQGKWSYSGGTLTVQWPNGWKNVYTAATPSDRLTGESISPSGRRVPSTLERRDRGGPTSWLIGSWTYRTASGFTDTHEILEGGRMRPNGSWSLVDGRLVIEWPNGWRNVYPVGAPSSTLSGESIAPNGRRVNSTLERR